MLLAVVFNRMAMALVTLAGVAVVVFVLAITAFVVTVTHGGTVPAHPHHH